MRGSSANVLALRLAMATHAIASRKCIRHRFFGIFKSNESFVLVLLALIAINSIAILFAQMAS